MVSVSRTSKRGDARQNRGQGLPERFTRRGLRTGPVRGRLRRSEMTRNRVRTAARLVAPIWLLLGAGCHLLAGDFETEGAGGRDAVCEEESFACDGATLQQCTNQEWVSIQVCNQPELCLADEGRCQECSAGEHRCVGQRLEQCNVSLDGWTLVIDCDPSFVCDDVAADCVTCKAGSARCASDGVTLETCNVSASGWTSDTCALGCVDEPDDCDYCSDCAPDGRWVCSPCGKVLQCQGGAWRFDQDCLHVEQCIIDGTGGYCI